MGLHFSLLNVRGSLVKHGAIDPILEPWSPETLKS